ncbi:unnamed protein product, partial [Urochloa humidicola]
DAAAVGNRGAGGGEVELPDEVVHGEAPGVPRHGDGVPCGGPLERPVPPAATDVAAPEPADPGGVALGGAVLGFVLAAISLHTAPAAVPVVVAAAAALVEALQVRIEQVVYSSASLPPATPPWWFQSSASNLGGGRWDAGAGKYL